MKISERDLKLILAVLIIGVISLAWWGQSQIKSNNLNTENEIKALQTKFDDLKIKDANRKKYTDDTANKLTLYKGLMQQYGNGLDQEHIIMLLKAAELKTGVWISSASLQGISSVYTFGNVTSTNPSRPGEKVYLSDEIGVSSGLSINYEGTYEQFKDFIDYMNTHASKNLINTINMSYGKGEGTVRGSMQFNTYGIVGSQREYEELKIKDVYVGTENIFDSETFENVAIDGEYGNKIKTNYDLFLMLHAEDTDVDSVVVGQRDDITGEKTLCASSNVKEKVTIRVTGKAGEYKVSYKIGNETYPEDNYAEGEAFNCGDTLDLYVISSSRLSDDDHSGVELTIINNSDLVLNYKVVNDDDEDPRFTLGKVTGQVIGY